MLDHLDNNSSKTHGKPAPRFSANGALSCIFRPIALRRNTLPTAAVIALSGALVSAVSYREPRPDIDTSGLKTSDTTGTFDEFIFRYPKIPYPPLVVDPPSNAKRYERALARRDRLFSHPAIQGSFIPVEYYRIMDKLEGRGNHEPTSSVGFAQFIDKTLRRTVNKHMPQYRKWPLPRIRKSTNLLIRAAVAHTEDNYKTWEKTMGRTPTLGELYLSHNQGVDMAMALAKAAADDPNQNAKQAVAAIYADKRRREFIERYGKNPTARQIRRMEGVGRRRADNVVKTNFGGNTSRMTIADFMSTRLRPFEVPFTSPHVPTPVYPPVSSKKAKSPRPT